MSHYSQVQLEYRQKCKERIQRQLEISEKIVLLACLFVYRQMIVFKYFFIKNTVNFLFSAGPSVTDGEVEEMLESGNPAVFTQSVGQEMFLL